MVRKQYGWSKMHRSAHGRHQNAGFMTILFRPPSGPNQAGSVDPNTPTMGMPKPDAMCIGPISLQTRRLQRAKTAMNSRRGNATGTNEVGRSTGVFSFGS